MAAPSEVDAASSGEGDGGGSSFGSWLDERLEALGVDRAVYGAYILGVLQEEEEEEKLDALQGILSAFLEEDSLLNICKEIVERWSETQSVVTKVKKEDEVQAIATLIEKQAQIVVKPRMVSEEEKQRKAALLAQYADVTDEEEYPFQSLGTIPSLKPEAFAGSSGNHVLRSTVLEVISPSPGFQNPLEDVFILLSLLGAPFISRNSGQASIVSPISKTALNGQFIKNFPQRKHVNM
ncbi:coiled-coil domain-containing protein 43 isoform X1 [Pteropus medius]|uniref:Coiled-coil domain-containing protein 43 n=1 Tax=Pteropus vampyrus TaxID=132908 RepID=A0A6P3R4Z3_PTEVA|nr:coiled-coil domain-containing protein 43 isoform X1 [Pteropus vampyrus]XP_039702653.1 coiled-coil domain-containing protein 43 isoform X1 [Pteropus giganteus]